MVNSNWSYNPETPNLGQIHNFFSRVTLKFDGWPWRTIEYLFYTTSSFVQHFKAIDIFKLELQSRNAQFGSKLAIFLSRVTLKINVWPWKTIGYLFYTTSNIVHHFKSIGEVTLELQTGNTQIGDFFVLPDLEIDVWPWKNNRAPLLCCFNLCASFHSQWWIQTGVTIRKRPIWVKSTIFLAVWPWNLTDDLEEQ